MAVPGNNRVHNFFDCPSAQLELVNTPIHKYFIQFWMDLLAVREDPSSFHAYYPAPEDKGNTCSHYELRRWCTQQAPWGREKTISAITARSGFGSALFAG